MSRAVVLPLMALLALSSCSAGSSSDSGGWSAVGPSGGVSNAPPSLATQEACRQRTNEAYDYRNRADTFPANSAVNTPLSAGYMGGVSSRGLSARFDYERAVANCERNAGTGAPLPEPMPAPTPPRTR